MWFITDFTHCDQGVKAENYLKFHAMPKSQPHPIQIHQRGLKLGHIGVTPFLMLTPTVSLSLRVKTLNGEAWYMLWTSAPRFCVIETISRLQFYLMVSQNILYA